MNMLSGAGPAEEVRPVAAATRIWSAAKGPLVEELIAASYAAHPLRSAADLTRAVRLPERV